jgi:hypothetical protein
MKIDPAFARADIAGDKPDELEAAAAVRAGWVADVDGWWVRHERNGDAGDDFFFSRRFANDGFTNEGQVFARTPAVALAYDRAGERV